MAALNIEDVFKTALKESHLRKFSPGPGARSGINREGGNKYVFYRNTGVVSSLSINPTLFAYLVSSLGGPLYVEGTSLTSSVRYQD
jgi:hypothetical protein